MPAETLYIVQQFEKRGRKLVAGLQMGLGSADTARARAERDADLCAGVVAVQRTVDPQTGDTLGDPIVLAAYGELPQKFRSE